MFGRNKSKESTGSNQGARLSKKELGFLADALHTAMHPRAAEEAMLQRAFPGATIINIGDGGVYAPSFDREKFAVAVENVLARLHVEPNELVDPPIEHEFPLE